MAQTEIPSGHSVGVSLARPGASEYKWALRKLALRSAGRNSFVRETSANAPQETRRGSEPGSLFVATILVPIECLEVVLLSASEVIREEPHKQQKQDSSQLIQVQQQPSKSDKREWRMRLYRPRVTKPACLDDFFSNWMRASVNNPRPSRMSNRPRKRIRVHGPSLRVTIKAATMTTGRAVINSVDPLT